MATSQRPMASYLFVSFLTAEWHVVDNFLILSQKPEARSQEGEPEAEYTRWRFFIRNS
jgi:hypothetical protein